MKRTGVLAVLEIIDAGKEVYFMCWVLMVVG